MFLLGNVDRTALLQYIEEVKTEHGAFHRCTICGLSKPSKSKCWDHIENVHFPTSFEYHCELCPYISRTQNASRIHKNRYHKIK